MAVDGPMYLDDEVTEVPNYERLDGGKRGVKVNSRVLETGILDLSAYCPRLSKQTDLKLYPDETKRLYEQLQNHFEDNNNE